MLISFKILTNRTVQTFSIFSRIKIARLIGLIEFIILAKF